MVSSQTKLCSEVQQSEEVSEYLSGESSVGCQRFPGAIIFRVSENVDCAVVFGSNRHHQECSRLVVFKHDTGNIILVIDNWMSVTRANSFQQLNEPPVPVLNLTKVHEFLDDCRSDLDLQKFHVIVYQSDDRVFGTDVVSFTRRHCVIEVEVDPLAYVEFVLVVAYSHEFD